MTSVLNVDTIAAKDGTSAATLTKQSPAKVWCNHSSDSTVNGSFNVSSTTDNPSTTGQTQVSFTNSMADANFVVTACNRHTSGGSFTQASDLATGSFRDYSFLSSDQSRPEKNVMAVAHGDLA